MAGINVIRYDDKPRKEKRVQPTKQQQQSNNVIGRRRASNVDLLGAVVGRTMKIESRHGMKVETSIDYGRN